MNALDAADLTVHDYPGGSESLAPRLGMTGAVLRNKVNVNNDRNHLTLAEADRLMRVTGDHRILQALAAAHGYALVPVEQGETDAPVLGLVLELGRTGGEVSRVVCEALADNVITPNEMAAISRASHDDQTALLHLVARLSRMTSRPRAE